MAAPGKLVLPSNVMGNGTLRGFPGLQAPAWTLGDPAAPVRASFVDIGSGHVHLGRNLSATANVELYVTYLGVPPGTSPRIDAPDPGNC
jgi:hypothetical protein